MFIRRYALILLPLILSLSIGASSATYKKMISFTGNRAQFPYSGLTFDDAGNAYGTTRLGGHRKGIVYQLSPIYGKAICPGSKSSCATIPAQLWDLRWCCG